MGEATGLTSAPVKDSTCTPLALAAVSCSTLGVNSKLGFEGKQ